MQGSYVKRIGKVRNDKVFEIMYKGNKIAETDINTLREKNKGDMKVQNV